MSDDEAFEPYYDPERREAMRKTMVAERLLPDLSLQNLSKTERAQIDGRLLAEDMAAADGISVDEMIDRWEAELESATQYSSLDEFMEMLRSYPAPESEK